MKKRPTIILVLLIAAINAHISAQGIRLGIGAGITHVQGPDIYTNDIGTGGAGFSSGYHIGLKGKLDIPVIPITPVGFITYYHFSGEQFTPLGNIETSQSIWSFGIGGEYELFPGPLKPYLVLDLALNNFGDLEVDAGSNLLGGSVTGNTASSRSRFGAAIGIGAELSLLIIDIDGSIKYHFMNLFGKETNEETVKLLSFNISVLF